jgi:hypothetical protein
MSFSRVVAFEKKYSGQESRKKILPFVELFTRSMKINRAYIDA